MIQTTLCISIHNHQSVLLNNDGAGFYSPIMIPVEDGFKSNEQQIIDTILRPLSIPANSLGYIGSASFKQPANPPQANERYMLYNISVLPNYQIHSDYPSLEWVKINTLISYEFTKKHLYLTEPVMKLMAEHFMTDIYHT
jgi:hypothetical protein